MNRVALPNEILLSSAEKALLRDCIKTLSAGSLSEELGRDSWTVRGLSSVNQKCFSPKCSSSDANTPFEYEKLREAIEGRERIGVFGFQLPRTSEMDNLPKHVIGRLLMTVTDDEQIVPVWRFISLLLR